MSEKRRLGRGLGALIPETVDEQESGAEVLLDQIIPNPFQPRTSFSEESIRELADSMKAHGMLQPVVLARADQEGQFYLVAGERRCRAAKIAGLKSVPAIIRSYDRKEMLEVALIENLQREDLNPVEEARGYKRLMNEFGYKQEELAVRIGKSRPAVANSIRLLSLPESVLDYLSKGTLRPGQARPLLSLDNEEEIVVYAEKIVTEGLTSRQVEEMVGSKNVGDNDKSKINKRKNQEGEEPPLTPIHSEIQLQIQRTLGTKVRLKEGKSGGTIEIFFYSEEDLERLVARLLPDGI